MGKLFGVILTIIALASAYPIVTHMYVQPVDISTHGHAIDEQFADTMAEAGLSSRTCPCANGGTPAASQYNSLALLLHEKLKDRR